MEEKKASIIETNSNKQGTTFTEKSLSKDNSQLNLHKIKEHQT